MSSRFWYLSAIVSFLALFSWLMVWHAWLSPSSRWPVALVLMVVIGPLLLPWRGLLKGRARSGLWLSYLSLPYLLHGVVEAYADPLQRYYALTESVFSILLCLSAGFYVYRSR